MPESARDTPCDRLNVACFRLASFYAVSFLPRYLKSEYRMKSRQCSDAIRKYWRLILATDPVCNAPYFLCKTSRSFSCLISCESSGHLHRAAGRPLRLKPPENRPSIAWLIRRTCSRVFCVVGLPTTRHKNPKGRECMHVYSMYKS